MVVEVVESKVVAAVVVGVVRCGMKVKRRETEVKERQRG